jgi:hypothetical protein
LRFVREEKITQRGGPLPENSITAAAQVEAAKSELEYLQRPDKTWVLIQRDRQLSLRIDPQAAGCPEVAELAQLLNLRPGQLSYDIIVGPQAEPFALVHPPEPAASIYLFPRSVMQATFYAAHGVAVPPEHLAAGVVKAAVDPDGTVFDWQQLTANLFTVCYAKQHRRPACAYVAVKHRGYWFYIDDRDNDSKISFSLLLIMTRSNLLGPRKEGPTLTLPVGR